MRDPHFCQCNTPPCPQRAPMTRRRRSSRVSSQLQCRQNASFTRASPLALTRPPNALSREAYAAKQKTTIERTSTTVSVLCWVSTRFSNAEKSGDVHRRNRIRLPFEIASPERDFSTDSSYGIPLIPDQEEHQHYKNGHTEKNSNILINLAGLKRRTRDKNSRRQRQKLILHLGCDLPESLGLGAGATMVPAIDCA